jgi:putative hydrolase of the HAD superfamily
VKALLLDLDDTLLDYSSGVDACWEAACASAAANVAQGPLVAALADTRRSFWRDPEHNRRERVNMLRAWTQIATQALEHCQGDPRLGAAIAEAFAARRRSVMTLFPDAQQFLTALHERGVPLGLVTNGDAREQWAKIDRHDLARFFGVIVVEGEFGAGKPDAAVYRAALGALGVPAGPEVWMAGDNLEFDIMGAQRLGLRGAWLDRPGLGVPADSAVRPDRIVRSLDELLAVLTSSLKP